mgnify:CR=1 FL=1|tara:strand:+ start:4170 stop:4391 length:222 start_codon:yes stop_codon:yes gene_type:complete
MRNLKMMAIAVLFGAMSFVGYGSSIGSSDDMKISGIETSDMGIDSRNRTTTTTTTTTTTSTTTTTGGAVLQAL